MSAETSGNSTESESHFSLLATEWEGTHNSWQLTHIRSHPNVKEMTEMGKEVLPLMFDRLKNNVLWYIPIEEIIREEFDEDLKSTNKDNPTLGKYSHLEGMREACLNWGKKKRLLD